MPNTAKFTTSRSIVSLADRTTRQTNERRVRRIVLDRAGGGVHERRALGAVAYAPSRPSWRPRRLPGSRPVKWASLGSGSVHSVWLDPTGKRLGLGSYCGDVGPTRIRRRAVPHEGRFPCAFGICADNCEGRRDRDKACGGLGQCQYGDDRRGYLVASPLGWQGDLLKAVWSLELVTERVMLARP